MSIVNFENLPSELQLQIVEHDQNSTVNFVNLPLGLKLQVVEHDPQLLQSLLLVDPEIYNYFNTDDGRIWLNSMGSVQVHTIVERGTLLLGNIQDGQWDYYERLGDIALLTKSAIYNLGNLYEVIIYFQDKHPTIKKIIPIERGQRNGIAVSYHQYPDIINTRTTYVDDVVVKKYKKYYPVAAYERFPRREKKYFR